eukprot:9487128-Alexandrium_andersonii.AAC.1
MLPSLRRLWSLPRESLELLVPHLCAVAAGCPLLAQTPPVVARRAALGCDCRRRLQSVAAYSLLQC